jgi:hypothetical protein
LANAQLRAADLLEGVCRELGLKLPPVGVDYPIRIWLSSHAPDVALGYLASRGLHLETLPPSIRGTAAFRVADKIPGAIREFPALLALVRTGTGAVTSVHRIALTSDLVKRVPEDMPMAPVRLGHVPKRDPVKKTLSNGNSQSQRSPYVELGDLTGDVLLYTEGIENGLAALEMHRQAYPGVPVRARAVLSVGNFGAQRVPDGVKTVVFCLDTDVAGSEATRLADLLQRTFYVPATVSVAFARPPRADGAAHKVDWLDAWVQDPQGAQAALVDALAQRATAAAVPAGRPALRLVGGGEGGGGGHSAGPADPGGGPLRSLHLLSEHPEAETYAFYTRVVLPRLPDTWYWHEGHAHSLDALSGVLTLVGVEQAIGLVGQLTDTGARDKDGGISYANTPRARVQTWWNLPQTQAAVKAAVPPLKGVVYFPVLVEDPETSLLSLLCDPGYSAKHALYLHMSDLDAEQMAVLHTKMDSVQACLPLDAATLRRRLCDPAASNARFIADVERRVLPLWDRADARWRMTSLARVWIRNRGNLLDLLSYALVDFMFATRSDWLTAVSLLLTPVLAAVAPPPMFFITAPAKGSGKSLLSMLLSQLWGPSRASMVDYINDDEELVKRLAAAFLATTPHLILDNVSGRLQSDVMAALLTSPKEYRARVLGGNSRVGAPPGLVVCATGIGLDMQEELVRRSVFIGLDTKMAAPETRKPEEFYNPEYVKWVSDPETQAHMRRAIYELCVTIYGRDGRVDVTVVPAESYRGFPARPAFPSFQMWSDVCMELIANIHLATCPFGAEIKALPAALRDWQADRGGRLSSGDRHIEQNMDFLEIWFARHQDNPVCSYQLYEMLQANEELLPWVRNKTPDRSGQMQKLYRWAEGLADRTLPLPGGAEVVVRKIPKKVRLPAMGANGKITTDARRALRLEVVKPGVQATPATGDGTAPPAANV